ncbi:MAG TPA: aldose 1-epimerase family protein, partial [Gemmatales bacterium]|nr:aldose 1-epimerase family protein [Gemmatales bacterium]
MPHDSWPRTVLTASASDHLHVGDWETTWPAGGDPSAPAVHVRKRTLQTGRSAGVELVEVRNGDLAFTIVPTRGMGLWSGTWRGQRLGWRAPVLGPVHPALVNLLDRDGLGWLDGFDEWVVRCGLASNGPPGLDPTTGQRLTLHGRVANQPAHHLEVRCQPTPPHAVQIVGQVQETTLFFADFLLTTRITVWPGRPELLIEDEVTNRRSQSAEMQLLYHCNFGPPLADAGSRVHVGHRSLRPRDERAAQGLETWSVVGPPTPGFAEQVFLFESQPDPNGQGWAVLHSPGADLGMRLRWTSDTLPYFNLWKNTVPHSDGYVVGLEPATG